MGLGSDPVKRIKDYSRNAVGEVLHNIWNLASWSTPPPPPSFSFGSSLCPCGSLLQDCFSVWGKNSYSFIKAQY